MWEVHVSRRTTEAEAGLSLPFVLQNRSLDVGHEDLLMHHDVLLVLFLLRVPFLSAAAAEAPSVPPPASPAPLSLPLHRTGAQGLVRGRRSTQQAGQTAK